MKKIPVSILGATGMVGQRFVCLLDQHPLFRIAALAASERSTGKTYAEACRWLLPEAMPTAVRDMPLLPVDGDFPEKIIFSALPGSAAAGIESELALKGCRVISNASTHRMDPNVPLLIPEVNPDHTALIHSQSAYKNDGFIVTSANCSTTILVLALKPLHTHFGIRQLTAVTMQAVSGAGYPGVSSLDILGNILPYIPGEEEKLESETRKLLGTLGDGMISPAEMSISAQCTRVPVVNGHTVFVSLSLEQKPALEELAEALATFQPPQEILDLPGSPLFPIRVHTEPDRPQPALDIHEGDGMAVSVGRVRPCSVHDYKFVVLGHNTLRGAAGGAIHNAELLYAQGLLD